jgi:hypothetical protein
VSELAEFWRTREERKVLWEAEEMAVQSCMRAKGFQYLTSPFESDDDDPSPPSTTLTAAFAAGELLDKPKRGATPMEQALDAMTPDAREAFLEALQGPDISVEDAPPDTVQTIDLPNGAKKWFFKNTCLAEARRRIYGEDYQVEHRIRQGVEASLVTEHQTDLLAMRAARREALFRAERMVGYAASDDET